MLPMEASGLIGRIDSTSKSYSKSEDQQSETMPGEKERCGVSQVLSSQFISLVPESMSVSAMSFQPAGFSHFEHSTSHSQWQLTFPYATPVNSLQRLQTQINPAPCAFYIHQNSGTYNCIDPYFSPNLGSSEIRNSIMPPSTRQDNNFFSMRNDNNGSVFLAPSSHFAPPAIPGFDFAVNFPFPRPDGTLEIMQSRNLEQRLSHEVTIVTRKELTKSDVGSIGRIVIPKKDAEANFPPLFDREGILLPMDDVALHVTWEFKYRFWPNNKSRMYILENTGEFVKTHGLQVGDYLSIHRSPALATYFVKGEKRS